MVKFMSSFRFLFLLFLLLTAFTAQAEQEKLEIVTSFSILADFAEKVGGDRVNVRSLIGPDEDAHNYQQRPSDARKVAEAQLIVTNGLGFDDWLIRLTRTARCQKRLTVVGQDIRALNLPKAISHRKEHPRDHDEADIDPHAWQDVANARRYVAAIANALIVIDPAGAETYHANAERYDHLLQELDLDIRAAVQALPKSRRKVVSAHAAFGYFERAYGIRFLSPVGVAGEAEPSAKSVARLINQIRELGIPAIFMENAADPRLLERIAAESGAKIGGTLYSDALTSKDGPAPDYISMMRHNLDALTKALAE